MSIHAVDEMLIALLKREVPLGDGSVVISSPVDVEDAVKLTLFLYSVVESPHLKNGNPRIVNSKTLERAPLCLDLYYMMTAHAKPTAISEAHTTLGDAMRALYDNSTLTASLLPDPLADLNSEIRISLNPITLEDLTRIWSVFPDTQYRISVSYLVTPVFIASKGVTKGQRVVTKETGYDEMVARGA